MKRIKHFKLNGFKKTMLVVGLLTSAVIGLEIFGSPSALSISQYRKELVQELDVKEGLLPGTYLLGLTFLKEALD